MFCSPSLWLVSRISCSWTSRPITSISTRFAGSRLFCRVPATLVFVTHDRVFLEKLATRIVELDRGRLYDWACDYPTFLTRRDEVLHAEARQQELFDKKLAQEEVWIRKGDRSPAHPQ